MTWFRSLGERFRALISKGRLDAEMEEELRFHLEMEREKNLRAGMTPREAHRQAMISFGGVDRFEEKTREERGVRPVEDLIRDLRFSLRSLRKSPVLVIVTVLSLGLGIAVSATVFSMANALVFGDPGPIRDPESVIAVYSGEDGRPYGEVSFPDYQDIRAEMGALEDLTAHRVGVVAIGDPMDRDRIIVEMVTGNYFQILGANPALGRAFLPQETGIGNAERLFVLSHRAWQERFGGDRGVLGTTVQLDGQSFTVIGVAPEGLMGRFVQMDVDGWIPLGIPGGTYRATPASLADRNDRQFYMVGRLKAGRTLEEAQAELSVLADRLHAEYGEVWEGSRGGGKILTAVSEAGSRLPPDGRIALMGIAGLFLAGALLILALACSNVASLLLARAHRRAHEMAIRTSLGAGRGRLLRMLLSESLLLAFLGGGLGLYLTYFSIGYLQAIPLPVDVPLRFDFSPDGRVVLFTLALSLGASVLAGIGPALQGSKADLTPALKKGPRQSRGRRRRRVTLRNFLVVGQVAAATTLVVAAGLAMRSVQASATYDVGLNGDDVAVMWKEPPKEELGPEQLRDHFLALAARIEAHPEVETVALGRTAEAHVFMEDFATALLELGNGEPASVGFNAVTPGYLEMLEIPLIRGRPFQATDVVGAPPVAVVNETFLERYLSGEGGVGERFAVTAWMDVGTRQARPGTTLEVVGVVASPLRPGGTRAGPFFWVSYLQDVPVRAIIHAKGRAGAEPLVPILRQEAPPRPDEFTLIDPGPYRDLIDYQFLGHRIISTVLTYTGLFALILAFIGVFGIVSFTVSQRFREMAIRQAMGAQRGQVVRAVVGQGIRTTGVGVVLGLLLAIPLAFLARSVLLGVAPLDPWAVGGGAGVLILAALVAGVIPARRLRVAEPMEVLRED